MKKTQETIVITISVDKSIKLLLEDYSNKYDLTLSKLARNLIYVTLDSFNLWDKISLSNPAYNFRIYISNFLPKKNKLSNLKTQNSGKQETISVIIDVKVKELMEKYAEELGITLKMFARNLIYIGLYDFNLLKDFGIMRIANSFRAFLETFEKLTSEQNKKS